MRALDLKLVRDLWRMRGQALAIAIVLAAGSATFILSVGVHRSLTVTRDAYYAQNHFADVSANMTRAPRSVVDRAAGIDGVQQAQGSIIQYAILDYPDRVDAVRALLQSVDERGQDRINLVTLKQGRLPTDGNPGEVIVDEAFAIANNVELGHEVDAIIYGRKQRLRIVGIGFAPNYINALAPGDIVPDDRRFGIFWMGRKALEAATDRTEAINTLTVTLQRGASEGDVIRAIDSLLEPYGGTGAYGREDHPSHMFLKSELDQLEAMVQVIPPVFLIVSTFLVYIVLGRMIRTQRSQIGLLKAFGYSNAAIGWHFLKFAFAIAMLATIIGSAAGVWMGRAMTEIYAGLFHFPFLRFSFAPSVFLGAAALAVGSAAFGALSGVAAAVRLTSAVAMSPPPPPVYRAGMVERIGQRAGLSATGHMIVRHIARWPARSAITISGVAISMGLLFSVLQFIDSSHFMLDSYFFRSQRQDISVTFTEPRNEDVLYALRQMPGVLRAEPINGLSVELSYGNRRERTALEATIPKSLLTARIDRDGKLIEMPPGGLMLSRQLAQQLGVQAGESVQVKMLGGRRSEAMLPVGAMVDEFIGARAYATDQTIADLTRDSASVGAVLLLIDPAKREALLAQLKAMPVTLSIGDRDLEMQRFSDLIDQNINTMMVFYIAFASAIAVGVVYNSARILFSERAHELATLRVLGYHRSEVAIVLIGEIALLVIIAVPVGLTVGYWLAQFMVMMFSSDLFRLPFAPEKSTYAFAVIVVLLAALLTAVIVARRVLQLDMVRVLKARD
ncbi:FtsX-like permease family protein [Erythrobacter insulae]|uniref:FtsX-like permease family protein n=1 Tax=Erythrobacter insulae TaxID=2584124 RepID=A0A547PBX3_9SPHN|nr:ABC transporter permease [Erythrobacter insulae]TRD11633.1 FtsX-like permease family protein [Erythrobacter insulae]